MKTSIILLTLIIGISSSLTNAKHTPQTQRCFTEEEVDKSLMAVYGERLSFIAINGTRLLKIYINKESGTYTVMTVGEEACPLGSGEAWTVVPLAEGSPS